MMTKMFESQLGKNIEVYIDDMVVSEHVGDLGNIFEILKRHKLRLNASKCSFGVGSSKFLGYVVTHRGIEINPDQIATSLESQGGSEVDTDDYSLNRFISRSADRCRPFFQLLHKRKGFEWIEECASTF